MRVSVHQKEWRKCWGARYLSKNTVLSIKDTVKLSHTNAETMMNGFWRRRSSSGHTKHAQTHYKSQSIWPVAWTIFERKLCLLPQCGRYNVIRSKCLCIVWNKVRLGCVGGHDIQPRPMSVVSKSPYCRQLSLQQLLSALWPPTSFVHYSANTRYHTCYTFQFWNLNANSYSSLVSGKKAFITELKC
jgi:hypothetical protein